jgi:lycopene cyclase CruA
LIHELLYIEVPTPDTGAVLQWLRTELRLPEAIRGTIRPTDSGLVVSLDAPSVSASTTQQGSQVAISLWSVQRTTYLKAFRWATQPLKGPQRAHEAQVVAAVRQQVGDRFPTLYPAPPAIDLSQQSIFEALAPHYPLTVRYFQKMPNGAADLTRVYWWEQRWRDGTRNPQTPKAVVFEVAAASPTAASAPSYDLVYIGGALGVIHAAVMARRGYRVLLLERLPFGRMNREWNISRSEFQSLIDLGLFTPAEFEQLMAAEYVDGFSKFFDANNPPAARAAVLHTPTVLNVAIDAERLLRLCGDKLRQAGGDIWDETEFVQAEVSPQQVTVQATHLPTGAARVAQGRVLVDAMGTASPIAWQLNGGRAFDSVCPTVGAVISAGFAPGVWDATYGDVLNSHGDISRGRQLIWELFPAADGELTFYLFHYHQVHPDNPGSLLELYEDFFAILPEYRRCDPDQLVWKKPTFGYIPGHFSTSSGDRQVAFDRLVALGDAASLQSPLIFTGFGSLVRNLGRLTHLLDTALQHDLLGASSLNQIRAYQSNVAVTWMFSKGMMVPTGRTLPPQRVNTMLNNFFGILAASSPATAEAFIKDRITWRAFNGMALVAAWNTPSILPWIWEMAGPMALGRWLGSYWDFTLTALISTLVAGWLPGLLRSLQPWLESHTPALWFWLLAQSYRYAGGIGPAPSVDRSPVAHPEPPQAHPEPPQGGVEMPVGGGRSST